MAMLYRADFCVGDTRSVVIVHTRRLRVRHRVAPGCGLGRVILRRRLVMVVVVCLAAAGAFAYEGAGVSATNPRAVVFGALNNASVTALAALARTDEATVTERLKAIGVEVKSAEDTVAGLAQASGHDSFELLGTALAAATASGQPAL